MTQSAASTLDFICVVYVRSDLVEQRTVISLDALVALFCDPISPFLFVTVSPSLFLQPLVTDVLAVLSLRSGASYPRLERDTNIPNIYSRLIGT